MINKFSQDFQDLSTDALSDLGFTKVWQGTAQDSFKEWKRWDAIVGNDNHREVLIQVRESAPNGVEIWVSNGLIDWLHVHEFSEYRPNPASLGTNIRSAARSAFV